MAEEILAPQYEQFARLAGGGIGGAALAVEHRDLAEQMAGAHEIQGPAAAVGGAGLRPDLRAAYADKRGAGIALLDQHFADPERMRRAPAGGRDQSVGPQIRA